MFHIKFDFSRSSGFWGQNVFERTDDDGRRTIGMNSPYKTSAQELTKKMNIYNTKVRDMRQMMAFYSVFTW